MRRIAAVAALALAACTDTSELEERVAMLEKTNAEQQREVARLRSELSEARSAQESQCAALGDSMLLALQTIGQLVTFVDAVHRVTLTSAAEAQQRLATLQLDPDQRAEGVAEFCSRLSAR